MITSKDRAYLKRIIACEQPVCQVGKEGLSVSCLESVKLALLAREVIKINVLQNCDQSAREVAEELKQSLLCEIVGVIGRKVIVYKLNPKNKTHVLSK